MHLLMRGRNLNISDALADHCLRKLFSALRRFQGRVGKIRVRLADVNGPRGGIDKQCQLLVELPSIGQLVITSVDADPYCAISRAADRAKHSLSRELKRRKLPRRPRGEGAQLPGGADDDPIDLH